MNRRCGMDGQWEQLKVNAICRPLDQQQKITRWKSLAKFYGIEVSRVVVCVWLIFAKTKIILFYIFAFLRYYGGKACHCNKNRLGFFEVYEI